MTAKDILQLINKQWATVSDIMKLGELGYKTANEIKNSISREILKPGQKLPYGKVPMDRVVEHLHINIKYLKRVANNEAQNE